MNALGRRGACLLLGGIIWLFIAWGVWKMPPLTRPPAPHEMLPQWLRILGWLLGSWLALISSVMPQGRDKWGFFALVLMPAERVFSWALVLLLWAHDKAELGLHIVNPAAWAFTDYLHDRFIPLPPLGVALSGVSVWAAVAAFLIVISGWPEYPKAENNGAI